MNKNEQQEVADRIDKLVSPQTDISESVHSPLITRQRVPGEYELHKPALAEQNMEHVYSLSANNEEKEVKALHQAWLQSYKLRQILANKEVFVPLSHTLLGKLKQQKLVKHPIKNVRTQSCT